MRKFFVFNKARRVFLLSLGVLLAATLAFAGERKERLSLSIKSEKSVYIPGEEISFTVELTNTGARAFYLNTWIFFHPYELSAVVRGPDGDVVKTVPVQYDAMMYQKDHYVLLRPEEAYSVTLRTEQWGDVPYNFLGYEFKALGKYRISIEYENEVESYFIPGGQGPVKVENVWKGKVASNIVTVEVKEAGKTSAGKGAIERLAAKLSADPLWMNGMYPAINLPATASPEEVVAEVFKLWGFDEGHVTEYTIRQVKDVQIPGSLPDEYTAALTLTDFGEKIVLIKYEGGATGWWSRVFDSSNNPEAVLNEP